MGPHVDERCATVSREILPVLPVHMKCRHPPRGSIAVHFDPTSSSTLIELLRLKTPRSTWPVARQISHPIDPSPMQRRHGIFCHGPSSSLNLLDARRNFRCESCNTEPSVTSFPSLFEQNRRATTGHTLNQSAASSQTSIRTGSTHASNMMLRSGTEQIVVLHRAQSIQFAHSTEGENCCSPAMWNSYALSSCLSETHRHRVINLATLLDCGGLRESPLPTELTRWLS